MIEILRLDDVALQRHLADPPEATPRSDVTVRGRQAPQPLAGVVLEAAFTCEGHTLLFLTDDVPYEDALHIHLLDENLALIDSASLSWMYATGSFEVVGLEQPRSLRFRFFGETDWGVELLDEPAARVPLITEPRGVHRKFGFLRHFKVHGNPRPMRHPLR